MPAAGPLVMICARDVASVPQSVVPQRVQFSITRLPLPFAANVATAAMSEADDCGYVLWNAQFLNHWNVSSGFVPEDLM